MSMVFDKFPSMANAEAFVKEAKARFDLGGQVFITHEDSQLDDWCPFLREPPVAHIDRVEFDDTLDADTDVARCVAAEERVAELAAEYGGDFLGT